MAKTIEVGTEVEVLKNYTTYGWYGTKSYKTPMPGKHTEGNEWLRLEVGATATVVKVLASGYHIEADGCTYSVPKSWVKVPIVVDHPKPISSDLDYLWDALQDYLMGDILTEKEYVKLTEALKIPGPKHDITVDTFLPNGLLAQVTVSARSVEEAEKLVNG